MPNRCFVRGCSNYSDLRPLLKKKVIGNLFSRAFIELQNCSEAYDYSLGEILENLKKERDKMLRVPDWVQDISPINFTAFP
jgi:hypothetical protein